MSAADTVTNLESGHELTGDVRRAFHVSKLAYADNRPAFLDLGIRATADNGGEEPVLHRLVHESVDLCIYEPLTNAPTNTPTFVGLKGTATMYNFVKDLALIEFPNTGLFDAHFDAATDRKSVV